MQIERISVRRWRVSASLWLPHSREHIFDFFARAENLNLITPPWVHFQIKTPLPVAMDKGVHIDYTIRLHGIPVAWKTEITTWEPSRRFIDEQLNGPYRVWIHEHTFEAVDGGTLCRDQVDYEPPGGAIINRWFVQPDVFKIFSYRHHKMKELFA